MAGRPSVNANFAINVDGVDCGIVSKVEGGNYKAEVATLAQNHGYFNLKHLTTVKPEPIKLTMAAIQGGPLYAAIQKLLAMDHQYINGAIHALDFNLKTKAIREFTEGLITEVTLPAVDGANKDAAYLNCTIECTKIRNKKGDDSAGSGASNAKQQTLAGSNFRLTIDKCKDSMKRVAKSDAYKISTKVARDEIGDAREYEMVPSAGVDFANLVFEVAEVDADALYAWHEDFVINGNCGQEAETGGQLSYFSQNFQNELITVTFKNVGVFNISSTASEDHKDAIKRVKVECYVTSADIVFNA